MRLELEQLKNAFLTLNNEFFGGQLPIPVFVNGNRKRIFYFDNEKYRMIVGSGIKNANLYQALDDLLHQMCHMFNTLHGIKDQVSDYHNKKFKSVALQVGLILSKNKNQGCTTGKYVGEVINPTKESQERKERCYRMIDLDLKAIVEIIPAKKQFFLKYECGCPSPYNSIRSGRRPDGNHRLSIVCQDCGQLFKCVGLD